MVAPAIFAAAAPAVSGGLGGALASGAAFLGKYGGLIGGVGGLLGGGGGDDDKDYDRFMDRSERAEESVRASTWRRKKANRSLTNILMKNILTGQQGRMDLAQAGIGPIMEQITGAYEGAEQKLSEGGRARLGYRLGRQVDESYLDPIESLAPDIGYLQEAEMPDFQTKLPKIGTKAGQQKAPIANLTPEQETAIAEAFGTLNGSLSALAAG